MKLHNQYCRNERLEVIRLGLDRRKVAIFDLKNFLRICYLGLDIIQDGTNDKYFDPKVAAWILKPGENEMTLSTLVMTYRPGMFLIFYLFAKRMKCYNFFNSLDFLVRKIFRCR